MNPLTSIKFYNDETSMFIWKTESLGASDGLEPMCQEFDATSGLVVTQSELVYLAAMLFKPRKEGEKEKSQE